MAGSCPAGTVKRELGCAAGVVEAGVHGSPRQSMISASGRSIPSHHTSPSTVRAVFVKMVFFITMAIALGLVSSFVPGATPKNPASGLMAYRRPSAPGFIQQMSSPSVSTLQPGSVGTNMARLVLPQAEGKAPAMYIATPWGFVSFKINMCSANQPPSRAITLAMRRA